MDGRFLLEIFFFSMFLYTVDCTFYYNPGTIDIHENEDNQQALHTFTADCDVQYTCAYYYYVQTSATHCGGYDFWGSCDSYYNTYGSEIRIGYQTCSTTVTCNTCSYSGDGRFYLSSWTFYKRACTSPGCGPTCSAAYCNNAGESYSATITCWHSGYDVSTGSNSMTFSISITQNAAPTFYWYNGDPLNVYTTSGVGSVVNRVIASDSDSNVDGGAIYYTMTVGVDPSYVFARTLFTFDSSNGYVMVNSDLTVEFSNYYTMTVCVYDRREDQTCDTLDITLHACYQTPNCTDKSNYNIIDTHGTYSGHGTTNTLYTMTYREPDDQFPSFNAGWHQLNWAFTQNDFDSLSDPPVVIDLYTGEIYITRNISIFPSWPYQDFTMIVEVSNPSASCYTTTCTFQTRVYYTNWPIEMRSLPATTYLHEDTDAETLIHWIILFDYNYHWEDNFTCVMGTVTSDTGVNMGSMFEVRQISGTSYAYNSWGIYKLQCQAAGCGYLAESFLCPEDIGCMNHNITQEYTIPVTCLDGYGTSDSADLTFRPVQNRAPYYTNIPKTITLDSDKVAYLDIVYSITYWDLEGESLYYRYVYIEDSTSQDPGFWYGTTWGNYYDSLGNISSTVHLWNTTNSTFTLYICGHERRNDICDYLYIRVQEYCGPTPACTGTSVTVTNEQTIGSELFDISTLVTAPSNGGSYAGLSYAIAHNDNLFVVDELTGSVTLSSELPAVFPSTSYSVSAYVYDTDACEYAQCTNTIVVTAVNNPISVTNLGASVNVHEDTTKETSLFTIATSDSDTDDSVSCSITSISPDESDPDHFMLVETFSGSEVFQVYTKQNPGFTASTLQYLVTVQCEDSRSSTSSGVLTVDIDQNQPPTLTNLANPTSIVIDPASVVSGDIVYTVSTSDTEGDAITFDCTIANTEVPFECYSTSSLNYIRLRRNLDVVTDNGNVYSVGVCISDAKHASAACGSLQTTITSTKTHPYISNLPATVTFDESTAIGTSLFDLEFVDPDVGETHTFSLRSVEPTSAVSLFSLVTSTGVVTSAGNFNFESQAEYSLEFLVEDTTLSATSTKYLTVTITNVNEAPTLTSSITYVNLTEGILPGTEIQFYFSVTDPDIGDTHTYSISSGTYAGSFTIDSATGLLTIDRTWDRENGDPPTTSLVIACTDTGGLSATTEVVMDFIDVNDNPPTFTVTGTSSGIQITPDTSIITNLVTVACSDLDVGNDGSCVFTILGLGLGNQLFIMAASSKRSVGTSAYLRLQANLNLDYNITYIFTIQVADSTDSDALFVGIPVSVTYTAPEVAAPTRPTACTTCTSRGKAMIGFLCLEAVIVFVIVGHLVWNFCFRKDTASDRPRSSKTKIMGAVIFSKNKAKTINVQPSLPTPSTSSDPNTPGTSGYQAKQHRPTTTTSRRYPSKRPMSNTSVTSGLYTKSSLGQHPGESIRGVHNARIDMDSSSSSDSSDSSDGEVTLPTRVFRSSPPSRDNPTVVIQTRGVPNTASSGLPNPIYR